MRFKLDENLPGTAKRVLVAAGHDVQSVFDQAMGGQPDGSVQAAAEREGRALMTFDLGFADIRSYPPGQHPGIIVLRLRSQDRGHVSEVLSQLLNSQDIEGFAGALVIVTEATVRVRRS